MADQKEIARSLAYEGLWNSAQEAIKALDGKSMATARTILVEATGVDPAEAGGAQKDSEELGESAKT